MSDKRWSSCFILCVMVSTLLLKAMVPMLVSLAAQAQGKPVFEICPLHGVNLSRSGHTSGKGVPAPAATKTPGEHCALTALQALTTPPEPNFDARSSVEVHAPSPVSMPLPIALDAATQWVAQHKHGPPAQA